jgi:predicted short-subunit dehydrogenase-like oxidoreductase (DUF2520 family)
MNIRSVAIIGTGNVAVHLAKAIHKAGISISGIYGRNQQQAQELADDFSAEACTQLELIPQSDLYIIAVKDDAIEQVSNQLPKVNGIVVHTSGITPLQVLSKHAKAGVLYPLQSFSKHTEIPFKGIPVLLEALHNEDLKKLELLVNTCGGKPISIDSENRKVVHLAAVFANNFTNHLYHTAEQILKARGLSFDILLPLITETARKVQSNPPHAVQTGPAKRNDMLTIEKHLNLLQQMPQYRQIYDLISQGIREAQNQSA